MGAVYSRNRAIDCLSQAYPEIAWYLDPSDLINLSRSCRLFWRAFSDDIVWRRSLQNSPTIPPCPVDRRHLAWALLHFTNECSVCGTPTENPIHTPLKICLCDSCERKELIASPWQTPSRYKYWHQGVRVFEQVVLRRDLERWVGRGGKVESGGAPKSAAIMYPAQSLPNNWLHPQVMYMRVVTEQSSPQRRPPTYFAQQISDAWLGPDVQRMRLDSQTFHGVPGGPSTQVVGTEQGVGVDANTSATAGLTLGNVGEYTRLDVTNGPPSPSSSDTGSSSTAGSWSRF